MNPRGLRRYLDDLLQGRRPKPFHPDDFEAAQIRTAIDLQAARLGSDAPREEFLADLRSRIAAQHNSAERPAPEPSATRRNVIVGTPRPRPPQLPRYRSIERWSTAVRVATTTTSVPTNSNLTAAMERVATSAELPTESFGRSTSARSSDSFAVSTASPKPCPGCAHTRAAGCGSTRLTTGCAAHAIRRRSRPPAGY